MMKTSKTVAACATAFALVLPLAACGSSEDAASGGLSTAAEAPGQADSASQVDADNDGTPDAEDADTGADKADDAKKPAGNKSGDDKKPSGNNAQGGQAQGEAPTIANPFENGMPENTNQPIEGGQEGSAEDRKQMEETARAVLNPPSFAGWTRTILENSCSAVVDPMMDELNRQGLTLEQVEEAGRLAEAQGQGLDVPRSEVSISDVRVDGNRASASLTVRSDGNEQTETMIYEKEDGRWKLCN